MIDGILGPESLRGIVGGRWLRRPEAGPDPIGVGIDTRAELADRIFIALRGATHDGHDHLARAAAAGARIAIVDRDVPELPRSGTMGVLRVEDARIALGRIGRAWRRGLRGVRVVAITGSCGKTTTRRLIDAALAATHIGASAERSFNNEIGVPLTLLRGRPGDRYLLVEIGTNAPGEIAQLAALAEPDLVVVTNVGRAHLAGLGSLEAVAAEKGSIVDALDADGVAILHDGPLLDLAARRARHGVRFGDRPESDLRLTARGTDGAETWFEVNGRRRFRLGLPGRHNAINALAALAVARRFGVADEAIEAGLAGLRPDAMRFAPEEHGGIRYWNDAYNANPDSTAAGIEAFGEVAAGAARRIVILGDMLELGEEAIALHRGLAPALAALDPDGIVLVGPLAGSIAAALDPGRRARVRCHDRLDDAATAAIRGELRRGDAVLLKASRGVGLERIIARDEVAPTCSTPCFS